MEDDPSSALGPFHDTPPPPEPQELQQQRPDDTDPPDLVIGPSDRMATKYRAAIKTVQAVKENPDLVVIDVLGDGESPSP